MPLVDIITKRDADVPESTLRRVMEAIPEVFVRHALELGLAPNTPPEGVQVMRGWFSPGDVNVPDIWVKIQFSEPYPGEEPFLRIRDTARNLIVRSFQKRWYEPVSIAIDLFPGPTHGWLMIDGVEIEW